ncbi:phage holin family protein [Arthrobacter roseus]|uniref:phage holin family protein n=1 Tax=Arthrobacter roseus TaxID=136274 RepID=UPI001965B92F|nr:phage holin family protein [Arthrobacter roseus]MBM7847028.1 putative membrane protein [Arthrobacter roseus]
MLRFIVQIVVNALALWVAARLLPGISWESTAGDGDQRVHTLLGFLVIGLIFGLVNAIVRPVVKLLSLPLTILTLGLFTIIINAAMLMLTAWITEFTPVQFTIDSFFWTAILGALIISLISLVASMVLPNKK